MASVVVSPHAPARYRARVDAHVGNEFDRGKQSLTVAVNGPLIVDDVALVIRAAIDGVGLAFMDEERVASHLTSGALVRVLEDWCPPFPGFFLYYPSQLLSKSTAATTGTLGAYRDSALPPGKNHGPLITFQGVACCEFRCELPLQDSNLDYRIQRGRHDALNSSNWQALTRARVTHC